MSQPPSADISEQVLELLTHGTGLGDIFNYSDDEYEAMYALGHGHYSHERYLDAAKCFGFLVMSNTMEPRFVTAFASALQMLRQYREAIQYHSLASIMRLSDPLPTFHTAECLMALDMPQEASEALNIVISQCNAPQWEELRNRSQALLQLLGSQGVESAAPQSAEVVQ